MIFALIAPYLLYLELWYIFFPLCAILLFAGVVAMPTDKPGQSQHEYGVSPISLVANVLLFFVVVYHFKVHEAGPVLYSSMAAAYVLLGVGWSLFKWRRLVFDVKEDLLCKIDTWCDSRTASWANIRTDGGDPDIRVAFYTWLRERSDIRFYTRLPGMQVLEKREVEKPHPYNSQPSIVHENVYDPLTWEVARRCVTPSVGFHKGQILMWVLCWPMSVIKWFLADMVRDIANFIYSAIQGQFQKMADRQFKDL